MMTFFSYCGLAPGAGLAGGYHGKDPVVLTLFLVFLVWGLTEARHRPAFVLAWALLVLLFVTPFCALSSALLSARTLQHLLLVSVIAPLLAVSLPLRLAGGGMALLALTQILLLWHVPAFLSAAGADPRIFWLMQTVLLVAAVVFWSAVFASWQGEKGGLLPEGAPSAGRGERPGRADPAAGRAPGEGPADAPGLIAGLALVMGLIGGKLTLSDRLFYSQAQGLSPSWGLKPLQDQHLAGLMLWIPGIIPLGLIAVLLWQSDGRRSPEPRTRPGVKPAG